MSIAEWTPCSYHAHVGTYAGGAVSDGKASARCHYCVVKTINSLLAAVTALTILTDQLAGIAKHQDETMDQYFDRMSGIQ